jgi:hypothetical protein
MHAPSLHIEYKYIYGQVIASKFRHKFQTLVSNLTLCEVSNHFEVSAFNIIIGYKMSLKSTAQY